MPDAPNTDAPVVPADTPPPATAPPADAGPKWDGAFDPDRAARLVANLRDESAGYKSALSEVQAKLAEFETAQMSEAEKLAQRATTAEGELKALRRDKAVSDALRKHALTDDDAEFLTGETAEEIDAKAAKYAARAGSKPAQDETPPHLLPVPGNGTDPSATRQLSREEIAGMSNADLMTAYRAGRMRDIGGK